MFTCVGQFTSSAVGAEAVGRHCGEELPELAESPKGFRKPGQEKNTEVREFTQLQRHLLDGGRS